MQGCNWGVSASSVDESEREGGLHETYGIGSLLERLNDRVEGGVGILGLGLAQQISDVVGIGAKGHGLQHLGQLVLGEVLGEGVGEQVVAHSLDDRRELAFQLCQFLDGGLENGDPGARCFGGLVAVATLLGIRIGLTSHVAHEARVVDIAELVERAVVLIDRLP